MKCFVEDDGNAVPLVLLTADQLTAWLDAAPARDAAWVKASRFLAKEHTSVALPTESGEIGQVLVGLGSGIDVFSLGNLAKTLTPEKAYRIDSNVTGSEANDLATGWRLAVISSADIAQ